MHALRRAHLELAALSDHRLSVVRPHASRVHNLLGTNLETLARLHIVGQYTDDALPHLDEVFDSNAVCHVSPIVTRRACEGRHIARVVDLGVVVGESATECIAAQTWCCAKHLAASEMTVMRNTGRPTARVAQKVVEQHSRTDI